MVAETCIYVPKVIFLCAWNNLVRNTLSSIVLDGSVIILMIRPAAAIKDFEKYTNNTFITNIYLTVS